MTGQGGGRVQVGTAEVSVELRAVNNRHLKLQSRVGDALASLEPALEAKLRREIRRGSLQLNMQLIGGKPSAAYSLQSEVLKSYLQQAREVAAEVDGGDVRLVDLLSLPGCIQEVRQGGLTVELDPAIREAAEQALELAINDLVAMRESEGRSMQKDLLGQLERLQGLCEQVRKRAPVVMAEFSKRLNDRIESTVAEAVAPADLSREVVLLADKLDVREEIVRLDSHFEQFGKHAGADECEGRRLDFLIQEMFREVNTIGSKANDAEIAQHVVEMKTTIEQMRELVQNVE